MPQKMNVRVSLLSNTDHFAGEVDAHSIHAMRGKIPGNMTGPATRITNRPMIAHEHSKSVQNRAIKRFVVQFVENPSSIFLGNRVIASLDEGLIGVEHSN